MQKKANAALILFLGDASQSSAVVFLSNAARILQRNNFRFSTY